MHSINYEIEIQRVRIYKPKTALIIRSLILRRSCRIKQNLPVQNDVLFEPRLPITIGLMNLLSFNLLTGGTKRSPAPPKPKAAVC
jgi:hypothetical protein